MNIKKNKENRIWTKVNRKDYRDSKVLQNDHHAGYVAATQGDKYLVMTISSYTRLVERKQKRAEMKAAAKIELSSVNVRGQSSESRV